MATTFETSSLLETIASLEKQLATLKSQLGAGGAVEKAPKKKRAVNPDAKPNPWIQFLKRVQAALKESETKGPATIGVLFAQHLKESGGLNDEGKPAAYEMEEDSIKSAFTEWATPERIEHAKSLKRGGGSKKEKAEAAASDSEEEKQTATLTAAEPAAEPAEKKKRAPMSEEAKAKAKAKREATKAAKAAPKTYTMAELQD